MNGVVVITGANAGIGRAATQQLAVRGAEVVMACRSMDSAEAVRDAIAASTGNTRLHVAHVDMSSMASVVQFAQRCLEQWPLVHALINNAGNFDLTQKTPVFTAEGFETIWATNYLGPWLLTERLLPGLRASSPGRVIDVSSKGLLAHPFMRLDLTNVDGHKRYSPSSAYYHSKLALLTHTLDFAARHEGSVIANAVRVPAVQVDLDRLPSLPAWQLAAYKLKRRFSITPETIAETYVALALDDDWSARSGAFVDEHQRLVDPPKGARDSDASAALERHSRQVLSGFLP